MLNERIEATPVTPGKRVDGRGIRFIVPSSGLEDMQATTEGVTWSWILSGGFAYVDENSKLSDGGKCHWVVGFTDQLAHVIVVPSAGNLPSFYLPFERSGLLAEVSSRKTLLGRMQVLRVKLMAKGGLLMVFADEAMTFSGRSAITANRLTDFATFCGGFAERVVSKPV